MNAALQPAEKLDLELFDGAQLWLRKTRLPDLFW
jgi:hypothetical protein